MHEHLADLSLQVYLPSLGVDPESISCLCGQLQRQDARGGGKCLRLCMTRKRIAVAAEDYQIICFSARPTICLLTQLKSKSSSMFRIVSRGKIERILRISICPNRQILVPRGPQCRWS